MIRVDCPECDGVSIVDVESREDAEGATMDCTYCESLLLFQGGQVKNFHKALNEENSAWPADGRGTGCLAGGLR
jgi:hypothetical protein